MRTFIAVEVPKDVQRVVGDYIDSIKEIVHNVKWVEPQNLHFTIKFLGEVKNSDVKSIKDCVSHVASEFSPFAMGLSGTGFFPSEYRPKVIWIGADGGEDTLLDLYQDMERCIENIGFDREAKTFSPHLTIGRVKKFKNVDVPEGFPDFEPVMFNVSGLAVMKSTLTPDGPIYEKVFEAELKTIHEYEQDIR
jgi:RNA 2',3'-cyclic 3'-phosphodiesterase